MEPAELAPEVVDLQNYSQCAVQSFELTTLGGDTNFASPDVGVALHIGSEVLNLNKKKRHILTEEAQNEARLKNRYSPWHDTTIRHTDGVRVMRVENKKGNFIQRLFE